MNARPSRLCALNAGIQLVWGAILAVSLQERSIALGGAGDAGVRAYAFVAAAGATVATIVQLVAGRLSDDARRRGRTRDAFYLVGICAAIPALGWFYLASDYTQLVAAFLLLQLAINVAGGPYQAVIPDFVERAARGRASSWMAAYQSAGNVAGLLIAGFVHDLRAVALTIAAALGASYAVTAAHVRALRAQPVPPAAPVMLGGPLVVLLVSRGLINVGFFTLLGFLAFFVTDSLALGGSDARTQTGLLFVTFTMAAVAGAVAAARPTDRYDKRAVVSVAVAPIVLALAALAAAQTLPQAYAAAAVAGIGWGAFVTADWALATALLPPQTMATAMGIWNVATTVPQVIAPLVTAPLVVKLGAHGGAGPRAAIVLALVEFALGATFVWRLPRA